MFVFRYRCSLGSAKKLALFKSSQCSLWSLSNPREVTGHCCATFKAASYTLCLLCVCLAGAAGLTRLNDVIYPLRQGFPSFSACDPQNNGTSD